MSLNPIVKKMHRLHAGGKPRVLDLFAGCGGISVGFQAAGFELTAAVEFDADAARSHGLNFHSGDPKHSVARDIIRTHPEDLVLELGLGSVEDAFDILVGGPPCQAFARVGRSKLREIEEHPEAFIHDPRAQLYREYLRYIDAFKPLAVLVENVPDVMNHGGQNIAEEICEVLEAKGYVCAYSLLNAAFYGVPQMRERMFLIAYRKEVSTQIVFPKPTHWLELPPGYDGTRAVALKAIKSNAHKAHRYVPSPTATSDLPPAITAVEAIGDLPKIYAREALADGTLKKGARRFVDPIPYTPGKTDKYVETMKIWPSFEAPKDGIKDHLIRYLPRDYELFARLDAGDQYPEAHRHATAMFEERLATLRASGKVLEEGSSEYMALKNSIVPPYDAGKFPNKWRKMWRNQPARTLLAHLGKDGYSHIHYDSDQARTISVREAARLQSFPDGFIFSGTMNPAFKQIGNAVPPLMAKALADVIYQTLTNSKNGVCNELAGASEAV